MLGGVKGRGGRGRRGDGSAAWDKPDLNGGVKRSQAIKNDTSVDTYREEI